MTYVRQHTIKKISRIDNLLSFGSLLKIAFVTSVNDLKKVFKEMKRQRHNK